MESLKFLLSRFDQWLPSELAFKQKLAATIERAAGHPIPIKAIRVVGRTVYLDLPPALKSEVWLRRQQISTALKII